MWRVACGMWHVCDDILSSLPVTAHFLLSMGFMLIVVGIVVAAVVT